jgi:glycine cleavage system transcriptional repressor
MKNYLLVAAGPDRTGIVASVTGLLYRHGCNLADSSMTRLASEFSMLLIFQTPRGFDLERFRRDAVSLRGQGLFVDVKPLLAAELAPSKPLRRPHIISVHGGDRPGIVYHVSQFLAGKKVNITDVWTHRTRARGRSGYILFLEAELPSRLNARGLERLLGRIASRLKLRVSVRPVDSSPL